MTALNVIYIYIAFDNRSLPTYIADARLASERARPPSFCHSAIYDELLIVIYYELLIGRLSFYPRSSFSRVLQFAHFVSQQQMGLVYTSRCHSAGCYLQFVLLMIPPPPKPSANARSK